METPWRPLQRPSKVRHTQRVGESSCASGWLFSEASHSLVSRDLVLLTPLPPLSPRQTFMADPLTALSALSAIVAPAILVYREYESAVARRRLRLLTQQPRGGGGGGGARARQSARRTTARPPRARGGRNATCFTATATGGENVFTVPSADSGDGSGDSLELEYSRALVDHISTLLPVDSSLTARQLHLALLDGLLSPTSARQEAH